MINENPPKKELPTEKELMKQRILEGRRRREKLAADRTKALIASTRLSAEDFMIRITPMERW